jgi:hypothetical protein
MMIAATRYASRMVTDRDADADTETVAFGTPLSLSDAVDSRAS